MTTQPTTVPEPANPPSRLGTAVERHAMVMAVVSAVLVLAIGAVLLFVLKPTGGLRLILPALAIGGAWLAWNRSLGKVRRRK